MNVPHSGSDPPLRLLAAFTERYPGMQPGYVVQAAGREMWVAATIGDATAFTLHAPDLEGRASFDWRSAKNQRTLLRRPLPSWARYPAGVIVHLCANGLDLPGLDAVVVGTEASGPRYDFSLGVAFATLWYEIYELDYAPADMVDIVDHVRREYVKDV